MSTDTLELIELDEALDFKPGCEYCDNEATHQMTHPTQTVHVICTPCADAVRETMKHKDKMIQCVICIPNFSDMTIDTAFYADQCVLEPL